MRSEALAASWSSWQTPEAATLSRSATTAETSAGGTQMTVKPTIRFSPVDLKRLEGALRDLKGSQIQAATETGLRRAGRSFPGYMARAAAKHYSIAQRMLKQKINEPRVRGGALEVRSSAAPISGRHWKPSGGQRWVHKKGASIKVFKGGGRTARKNSFTNPIAGKGKSISTMLQGSPFVRIDGDSRLRIARVNGPSFHHLFVGGRHAGEIKQTVEELGSAKVTDRIVDALVAKSKGYLKRGRR